MLFGSMLEYWCGNGIAAQTSLAGVRASGEKRRPRGGESGRRQQLDKSQTMDGNRRQRGRAKVKGESDERGWHGLKKGHTHAGGFLPIQITSQARPVTAHENWNLC